MKIMKVCGAVAALLTATTLVGCGQAGPSDGEVTVEVRSLTDVPDGKIEIKILDEAGEPLAPKKRLDEGVSVQIAGIPFGYVKIEAVGYCSVSGSIDRLNPTMRLVMEGNGCTVTN